MLRLIRKGRETGYNFWNDHNVLPLDTVVILTSFQMGRDEMTSEEAATELEIIQKQIVGAFVRAELLGRVTVM